jgi:hypothetical protein
MAQAQSFSYFARFRFENPSSEFRKPEAKAPPSIASIIPTMHICGSRKEQRLTIT